MDLEKKLNSKTYRFFDYLFGLVIVNLMTIILSLLIVTLLPAVTTAYQTISDFKEVGPSKVFRMYFSNLKKHIEKLVFKWYTTYSYRCLYGHFAPFFREKGLGIIIGNPICNIFILSFLRRKKL